MVELCDSCVDRLEAALDTDDLREKNYHIREVLQACETDGLPDDETVELAPVPESTG